MIPKTCKHKGCGAPMGVMGLCYTHYDLWIKSPDCKLYCTCIDSSMFELADKVYIEWLDDNSTCN